jgi:hypothetical protein
MPNLELIFSYSTAIITGLMAKHEEYNMDTFITSVFDIAEAAAEEFENRYGNEISGDDTEDDSPD